MELWLGIVEQLVPGLVTGVFTLLLAVVRPWVMARCGRRVSGRTGTAIRRAGSDVPSRIFISFRTDDEPYGAALIHSVLSSWFGERTIFRSATSIRPGDDHVSALVDGVRRCEVLLVVIGPRWITSTGRNGQPRLADPNDWVYQELAMAFAQGKRVVPLLLSEARMPTALELPPGITMLSQCQYRRVGHRQFRADMRQIVADLAALFPDLTPPTL